jgi:beta-lysine N6-acetyltransferase
MSSPAEDLEMQQDVRSEIGDGDFHADIVLSDLNRRIQVLHFRGPDLGSMAEALRERARRAGYGKVFLKAPVQDRPELEEGGLEMEATIPGYFRGRPAAVMSTFTDPRRREQPHLEREQEILEIIQARPADPSLGPLPPGYELTRAVPEDAEDLAVLYGKVFASYPFPITEVDYLVETMQSHVVYRVVRDGEGRLVAAASAETNPDLANAEMTDFATLPSERGLGLAQLLLAALEDDMAEGGIPNLYTVARARSVGMNRVFHNRGYRWTGTLVNNCHIAGRFEDMHVWAKQLAGDS